MTVFLNKMQDGKVRTIKRRFCQTTAIRQNIPADPVIIWTHLTNTSDYSRWNSTIISIEGDIKEGENISLKNTFDSNRNFKLKVKEMIPEQKLVWGERLGQRTYTLGRKARSTLFTMTEKIGGIMFPLFANKIPSFDQFTSDLKKEAETIAQDNG